VTQQDGLDAGPEETRDAAPFGRPDGVSGGFAPRTEPPAYPPPPPTVSPAERNAFGRPAGSGAFAPTPGERIVPRHEPPLPVPAALRDAFGATPAAVDGFAAAPGTRLAPPGKPTGSPWWKADALRDPWRDPNSSYWLGGGALFSRGQFAQRDPEQDDETDPDVEDEKTEQAPTADARGGRPNLRLLAFLMVGALLLGAIGGVVGYFAADKGDTPLYRSDVSLPKTGQPANRPPNSVAGIAKRVGPAVVSITVKTDQGTGIGSGVVIDKNGYVLTNNHVVANATNKGKGSIVVGFSDEATATARIVGTDPTSDLAVIQVPTDKLTVAPLGDSDKLAVGDPVIAIGSPLGLTGTVTEGIVSAKNRPVPVSNDDGSLDAILSGIQTDAAINPGNSGGALVDASGAVVGINTAGRFSAGDNVPVSGIGFAIPINDARTIAAELIKTGRAIHGSLGLQGYSVTSGLRTGAYISQIDPNGPAAKAGLRKGDVITEAGGQVIQVYEALVVLAQQGKPGAKLPITYYRGSAKHTAIATLGSA
jgi:S1-C subfamily serine protease